MSSITEVVTESVSSRKRSCSTLGRVPMSEAMEKYNKAKAERLQSQIDRIGKAYCEAPTYYDFAETVYQILQEEGGEWASLGLVLFRTTSPALNGPLPELTAAEHASAPLRSAGTE